MSWIAALLLTSSVVCHTSDGPVVYSAPPAQAIRAWHVDGEWVLGVRYETGTLYRFDCESVSQVNPGVES